MTLAQRVRMARKHANLTQAALAEAAGIRQQVLSRIETGNIRETAAVVRIAVACGVRPEWLDQEDGPMVAADPLVHIPAAQRPLMDAALRRLAAGPLDTDVLSSLESALRLTAREPMPHYGSTGPPAPLEVPASLKRRATR